MEKEAFPLGHMERGVCGQAETQGGQLAHRAGSAYSLGEEQLNAMLWVPRAALLE